MTEPALGRRGGDQASMSIGEVLNRLRPEFPEVSISKIRFLEDQGLVEPQRAPSGYRRFSAQDVDRLRFVLAVQRDHYLPLRVIREHLQATDRGQESTAIPAGAVGPERSGPRLVSDVASAGEQHRAGSPQRLTPAQLQAAAEVGTELFNAMESYALVQVDPRDGNYDSDAVTVARTVRELAAFGIEPRHLRAFRTAAEREAGLIAQVVAPLRQPRGAAASGQADEVAREVSALAVRLHAALLKAALGRESG